MSENGSMMDSGSRHNQNETSQSFHVGHQCTSSQEAPSDSILSHLSNLKKSDNDSSTTGNPDCETRLWIGNLDSRLREYHLLKMVQRYGTIDNFDFLFHRSGPNAGLPRGYAFVTFQTKESAEACLKSLDGRRVMDKNVAVRWAHQATTNFGEDDSKIKAKLPALSMKKEESEVPKLTKEKTISAIEAKLKAMERETDGGPAGPSSSFFYQYNKEQPVATVKQRPRPYDRSRQFRGRRPYRR